jgi:Phospholipase A2-like domain
MNSGGELLNNIKQHFSKVDWLSLLGKINPFSTTGISNELHFFIPGLMQKPANWCGPFTDLKLRTEADGFTPKPFSQPINAVDEAAYFHDIQYRAADEAGDLEKTKELKHNADAILLENVNKIHPSDIVEKIMKFVVQKIIGFKLKQGFGLEEEDVYKTLSLKVPKHLSKGKGFSVPEEMNIAGVTDPGDLI